jgi:radical SAM superfamily enzyme YgiQ (UPF0313 family)
MPEKTNAKKKTDMKTMHIHLVGLNARFSHSCLPLFHVRNELERHCPQADIEIIQGTINDGYHDTLLRLLAGRPDAVLFSAAIWNGELIERLLVDLAGIRPDMPLVVGGPQAGVIGARLPPGLCTVVAGEIEAIPASFYEDLADGRLQGRYSGSFFRMRPPRLDFPYRDDDFARHLQNRHIYYESSRGCPFSCTYCLSAAEKGLWHKDLEQVLAELEMILRHRPQVVRFVDRTFNDRPERALVIWRFLAAQGSGTLFHFEIAPDRFTEEMFAFLAGVPHGLFQFEIGIQSTNMETLAVIERRIEPRQAHTILRRLAAPANIHLHADLILGLPGETRDSFLCSFAEVFAMGPHYIQMGLLKILPDTPIRRSAEGHGYRYCAAPPYSVLANRWLDQQDLAELYWFSECVEKFYNNRYFVTLWRYLRERDEDIAGFFLGLLAVCRRHDFFRLAATQEFMARLLCEAVADRSDKGLICDLLRYDWLRCGHRFLPAYLEMGSEAEPPARTRDRLYQNMPEELEGVWPRGGKNHFFRKAFCLRLPTKSLKIITGGTLPAGASLCFSAEKEDSLFRFTRVVPL